MGLTWTKRPWLSRVQVTRAVCLLVLLGVVTPVSILALPVVPGGQGFGMDTRAAYACGASPEILRVTNLNDSGAGSLRAALAASGPRVVIFETSGTIALNTDIEITEPCLIIAGQTAPSPGITLRDSGVSVYTHDVLIQHLRIRPGDRIRPTDCYLGQCGVRMPQTSGHDALLLYKVNSGATVYNIVLDHVSLSWAGGKNSNNITYDGGITYWRCIISEALYRSSNVIVDIGQPSSLGMLLGGQTKGISIIGNLFAHNSDRNPEIHEDSAVQFVNNVVYDWGKDQNNYQWASFVYAPGAGSVRATIVGNSYIAGPAPSPFWPLVAVGVWSADAGSQVYVSQNVLDETRQPVRDYVNYMSWEPRVSTPAVPLSGITVIGPAQVESFVLANAGARPADRDAVDARIVGDVKDRAGTVVSSQTQVGGWPTLAVNTRSLTVPANPHLPAPSGYTALEEWLHGYAATVEGTLPNAPPPLPKMPAPPTNVLLK
jgi:hypothetical protein